MVDSQPPARLHFLLGPVDEHGSDRNDESSESSMLHCGDPNDELS